MNPLTLIAPALLRVLGETAVYTRASTGQRVTLQVVVNRNAQAQLPEFAAARTLERRITLQCRRSDLPADLHPGDQFALTSETLIVKRLDADDGNTGLITCSVKVRE